MAKKRSKYIICIDLGGTNLRIALVNPSLKIIKRKSLYTGKFDNRDGLIRGICVSVKKFIQEGKLNRINILGIGIGVPGPVDFDCGRIQYLPNLRGWKGFPLKGILEKKSGFPVFIDNDANLMGLAELRMGAAKRFTNSLCLTLGTGVGGALIINKNLYRGSTFNAGEAGHMPINENGERCNCGGRACLEVYVGNKRILAIARKVFGRDITLEQLSGLAKKGNTAAVKVWNDTAAHIGVALSAVVNLLNPDAIVIGGGVANAGNVLFSRIRKTISGRAMPAQARHVKVLKAKLGNDAGLIGAAILVKENLQ